MSWRYTPPRKQMDYGSFSPSTPIVIDNGSCQFRIGWAGETDPRVTFRSLVQRPRHKATGEAVTIVGEHDPALLKYFDCTRSPPRSAFDANVVYQFDIMENILDYGFERLGVDGTEVDHPILMTECVCNPIHSRCRMAELLFETYGIPSIGFGVDAAFSYNYNRNLGICDKDGLAVCTGFTTSHVIPFIDGEPVFNASCRTNLGGYHITDYLKQLLALKYPYHTARFTTEKSEELKIEHCYIALDYFAELKLFQKGTKEAEEKTRIWELPWVPPAQEEPPSEEELARKAALREKQGQRLREMAAAKRASKISELENELHGLESLLQQLDDMDEDDMISLLAETKFASRQEIEAAHFRVTQSLRKAKGEPMEIEEQKELSLEEKFPLVNVPDDQLTPDQYKEKRKQIFLKTTTEGRQRARQKHLEERLQRERLNELEEEKRLENPELYLEQLRARYKELSEIVDQRKRLKTNGSNSNGNQNMSGSVGRGERLSAAQKERMRLLTTAAFDRGKGEDTFGARDEDWQLYKLMSKDNDDEDDPDENEAELTRIASRLQDIDPTFVAKLDSSDPQAAIEFQPRPLTADDFKIKLEVERFRCPEVLYRPPMLGVEQTGLDEMTGVSLKRLPFGEENGVKERMSSSILLTGGSCLFPGMIPRLEAGIRMLRPCLSPLKVLIAKDPILDAWRGASMFAAATQFSTQTLSSSDYYEIGENALRRYQLKYSLL